MRPRILITSDVSISATTGRPRATVPLTYVDAIRRSGGVPILAPPSVDDADEILSLVDGIVVPGGADFDPALLGEPAHPSVDVMDRRRQDMDLAIVRAAVARDIPYLGVCLGMQMLALVTGGRIMQDIPSMHPGALRHNSEPSDRVRHGVRVATGTRLAAIASEGEGEVNSTHHQAVSSVGSRARISAVAPDGIIEAIEVPDLDFCIGVQWHPEDLPGETLGDPLFEGLIVSANRYATKPRSRGVVP